MSLELPRKVRLASGESESLSPALGEACILQRPCHCTIGEKQANAGGGGGIPGVGCRQRHSGKRAGGHISVAVTCPPRPVEVPQEPAQATPT